MHLPPPSPPEGSVICPYSDQSTLSAFGFRDTAMFRISPTRHRQIRFLGQIDPTSCRPCSNSNLKTLDSAGFCVEISPSCSHIIATTSTRLARSNTPITTRGLWTTPDGEKGRQWERTFILGTCGVDQQLADLRKAPPKVLGLTHDCECIFTLSPLARR